MTTVKVKKFKAQAETDRFVLNQDIWIRCLNANHIDCVARWHGKGRYVAYRMSIWPSATGSYVHRVLGSLDNIEEIEVSIEFAKNHDIDYAQTTSLHR